MHEFRDTQGRTWLLTIDVVAMKRVRGALGINLYELIDDRCSGLAKLISDPIAFVDTLYVLCREQAESRKITDEDFGRSLVGDVYSDAVDAFCQEYTDFFPSRKRQVLRTIWEKVQAVDQQTTERVQTELEKMTVEDLVQRLNAPSGNARGSSG